MDTRKRPEGRFSHAGEAHFSESVRRRRHLRARFARAKALAIKAAIAAVGLFVGEAASSALAPAFDALGSAVRSALGL